MIYEHDPACSEIAARAIALRLGNSPDAPAHALGKVSLADGHQVNAHVVHSVDAIITDGVNVVLINRKNEPGIGKPALPGGFMDRIAGGVENVTQTAIREAKEEVGIDLTQVEKPVLGGNRNFNRPFDVRMAINNGLLRDYGISKGDVFMVSTFGVRFDVPDITQIPLCAGDDAQYARCMKIASLAKDTLGIRDHYMMIMEALQAKG